MDSNEYQHPPTELEVLALNNSYLRRTWFASQSTPMGTTSEPGEGQLSRPPLGETSRTEYTHTLSLPHKLAARQPLSTQRKPSINNTRKASGKARQADFLPEPVSSALTLRPTSDRELDGRSRSGHPHTLDIQSQLSDPSPEWHAPWKLMRVISGHLGWVRSLAVEPDNKWFASGAGDRTIKIWDLATGSLRLTLTGHISTVRGLAVSRRHPYLFSCGEDKMVKCWDLETNKVIRHYHGHLSGVYALSLHPTLDVLVTGGRDGVARVWDMRTRSNIHVLSGHTATVSDLRCQEADPQVITSSLDSTVRLWDLAAGKAMGVLTHHKKGVRALALHPTEFTFASASTGSIKQWKCPEGAFMQNFEGQNTIINTLCVNTDNVLFSGGDNGSMSFWDWKSGYQFQSLDTTAQPGSLDAEGGIMSATFDQSGMRLICGEADKTIKIWKQDEAATPQSHPINQSPSIVRRKF